MRTFKATVRAVKQAGFNGLCIPCTKPWQLLNEISSPGEWFPVSRMVEAIKEKGLKAALIVESFHSPLLWQHQHFTPPVSAAGVSYTADRWYYPLCPSNPLSRDRFDQLMSAVMFGTMPDYIFLDFLRFSFFWEVSELDIQHQMPPYCYCPFCLGEFSAELGEMVGTMAQISELLPEWLDWRHNVIYEYFLDAYNALGGRAEIMVSLPPLTLIDLPYTTGQLPSTFLHRGASISPLLYHAVIGKDLSWSEDRLTQYQLEFENTALRPSFEVTTQREIDRILQYSQPFDTALFFHWERFQNKTLRLNA